MINIQNRIENILENQNLNKSEKIAQLSSLLRGSGCEFFVDFDDTITDYRCLLYSKYKYLSKKNKHNSVNISDDFKINKDFLAFFKDKTPSNIVIISANNMHLLQDIVEKHQEIFDNSGINIIGIVGTINGFKITLKDKQQIIQKERPYISDIMEYNSFKKFENYICLDNYSIFTYAKTIIIKIYYYLLFIAKNA